MDNVEKFRGQTDGIILFIISKGDRHTDELKEITDKYFTGVKIGTLYSIITRLKTQKFLDEYRGSSFDGSRRKYYILTEKGKKYYNENYAHLFDDIEIPSPEKDLHKEQKTQKEVCSNEEFTTNVSPTINETIQNTSNNESFNTSIYSEMINSSVSENNIDDEIDFSILEEETNTQNSLKNTDSNEGFISYNTNLVVTEQPVEEDIDYDSIVNSNYEYTKVLNELYPKNVNIPKEIKEEFDESEEQVSDTTSKQTDWSEIYNLAEKEGIKIRTSSDTNRYQGSKILVTKLLTFSTFIIFCLSFIEYFILTAILNIDINKNHLLLIALIFGSIFIVSLISFILNPNAQVKNLPKFINMFEIALILTISTIIVSFSISAMQTTNYSNLILIFKKVILPGAISLNLPLLTIITYLLSKTENFQSL